jgi:hypothetical protein
MKISLFFANPAKRGKKVYVIIFRQKTQKIIANFLKKKWAEAHSSLQHDDFGDC